MKDASPKELENSLKTYCLKANKAEIDAVEAVEKFNILDDCKKIYFAKITEDQQGKSTAEKERKALLSKEWSDWIAGYQIARHEAARIKAEKNSHLRIWDTARSLLSSKNSERRTNT